jgi:hypothetical protein
MKYRKMKVALQLKYISYLYITIVFPFFKFLLQIICRAGGETNAKLKDKRAENIFQFDMTRPVILYHVLVFF